MRSSVRTWDTLEDMQNAVGQTIQRGDFVVQITRNSDGLLRRIGVVLGFTSVDDDHKVRCAFYDPTELSTSVTESAVLVDGLVLIDRRTVAHTVVTPLQYAYERGRAAL